MKESINKNSYFPASVPYVTVGKDQSEVFITWFVKGYDAKGKAVLSENGIETEFEAFETSASTAEPYYYNRAKITKFSETPIFFKLAAK